MTETIDLFDLISFPGWTDDKTCHRCGSVAIWLAGVSGSVVSGLKEECCHSEADKKKKKRDVQHTENLQIPPSVDKTTDNEPASAPQDASFVLHRSPQPSSSPPPWPFFCFICDLPLRAPLAPLSSSAPSSRPPAHTFQIFWSQKWLLKLIDFSLQLTPE